MKYNFLLIKIIVFTFFLFNIFTNIVQASNKVFIVMKVNNEIITNININEEYRYLIALNNDLKSLKEKEIFNIAKNSFLKEKDLLPSTSESYLDIGSNYGWFAGISWLESYSYILKFYSTNAYFDNGNEYSYECSLFTV